MDNSSGGRVETSRTRKSVSGKEMAICVRIGGVGRGAHMTNGCRPNTIHHPRSAAHPITVQPLPVAMDGVSPDVPWLPVTVMVWLEIVGSAV
jgi:hypothetical protein